MKSIWMLCVSAALAVFSSAEDQCPKKVYSPLSRLLAPGSAVTLHCGGDASLPGLSAPAEWSLNGRPLRSNPQRTVSEDSVLITAARINDAGNYTCHRGGQIIFTVNITVGVTPEKPVLSCYRKVPTQNVRCEWSATNRPIPAPSCKLLVRKRLIGQSSQYNCTFSSTKQRCSCVLPHVEGDTVLYLVSLCVSNSAGAQKSEDQTFTGDSIIKPDPPINVQVHAVMRSSRSLWVNWSKPLSWRTDFYRLRYQVRYRTDQQREYKLLPSRDPRLLISDAGPRRRYEVQVRGQEEFDHGQWSAWSHEAYGHTWAEPELQTQGYQSTHRVHKGVLAGTVGGTVDSLFSQSEGSGLGEEELEVQASSNGSDLLARHTGWVTGVTLLGAVILVSLFIAQYRKKLKAQLLKLGGLAPHFRPPFAKVREPQMTSDLQGIPLSSPPSSGAQAEGREEPTPLSSPAPPSPLHLMNMGYFLVPLREPQGGPSLEPRSQESEET
ncbi:interleukin-6 receptor subunit alpha-like [Acipenser ruthenus]|uniref:interleukin-6 receptor subunit alpha-like n=1 Tax=Acipenser ruthenus TaxID=7906 RepID=UPI002740B2A6|nr:interleukin-6 receptor subunit alpha-like [Acipenser ruthenus]